MRRGTRKTYRFELPNGVVIFVQPDTVKRLSKAHVLTKSTTDPRNFCFKPEVAHELKDVDFSSWTAKSSEYVMSGAFFKAMPTLTAGKPEAKQEDFLRFKKKRNAAGLRLREVGEAVGKSAEWIRLVEDGRLRLPLESLAAMEKVVDELVQLRNELRKAEADARDKVFANSKLPRRISNINP